MSADNGIYILKTKEGQHRVIHAQAIENLWWSFTKMGTGETICPTRVVELFGDCQYTYNRNIGRSIAFSMAGNISILEYGIREIYIDMTWNEIIKEAKINAVDEIEAIKDSGEENKWGCNLQQLHYISRKV